MYNLKNIFEGQNKNIDCDNIIILLDSFATEHDIKEVLFLFDKLGCPNIWTKTSYMGIMGYIQRIGDGVYITKVDGFVKYGYLLDNHSFDTKFPGKRVVYYKEFLEDYDNYDLIYKLFESKEEKEVPEVGDFMCCHTTGWSNGSGNPIEGECYEIINKIYEYGKWEYRLDITTEYTTTYTHDRYREWFDLVKKVDTINVFN